MMGDAFRKDHGKIVRMMVRSAGDQATAEDLTQEVFVKALEQQDRFEDRGSGSMSAWLRAIAKSVILMRNRKEEANARRQEKMKLRGPMMTPPLSPEEVVERNRFEAMFALLRASLTAEDHQFIQVWAAQRAGHISAVEAADELLISVPRYEAEKKRVRRLILKTAHELKQAPHGHAAAKPSPL
jgi:RNA polymerase sigma factor (sigma-70 family)